MIKVKTTSLDDYVPQGSARLQMMLIGGPGSGKTRMSSFWPRPIYANCEKGLASVADRSMPYVNIKSSEDMLDFVRAMAVESGKPPGTRTYSTVVIDTLDAYQRIVMDQWVRENRAERFTGYDAWGYLDARMGALLTRLLNLDMNVLVLVHYLDRVIKDGDEEMLRHELQLKGTTRETVINDFDLVGKIDTEWVAGPDGRVERRIITFKRTPQWPLLKDRLHLLEGGTHPITFTEEDYTGLFTRLMARLDAMQEAGAKTEGEESSLEVPPEETDVVTDPQGGPMPPAANRPVPFDQMKKPELVELASQIPELAGKPSNTLKAEFVAALEQHRLDHPDHWHDNGTYKGAPEAEQAAEQQVEESDSKPESSTETTPDSDANATESHNEVQEAPAEGRSEPESPPATITNERSGATREATEVPTADESSEPAVEPEGEITHDKAVTNVQEGLGADVAETYIDDPEACRQAVYDADGNLTKEGCHPDMEGEKKTYVQLGQLKLGRRACNACWDESRKTGKLPEGCGWGREYFRS